jgi:hypothetical protein
MAVSWPRVWRWIWRRSGRCELRAGGDHALWRRPSETPYRNVSNGSPARRAASLRCPSVAANP